MLDLDGCAGETGDFDGNLLRIFATGWSTVCWLIFVRLGANDVDNQRQVFDVDQGHAFFQSGPGARNGEQRTVLAMDCLDESSDA